MKLALAVLLYTRFSDDVIGVNWDTVEQRSLIDYISDHVKRYQVAMTLHTLMQSMVKEARMLAQRPDPTMDILNEATRLFKSVEVLVEMIEILKNG
jgi:hypothetical protein